MKGILLGERIPADATKYATYNISTSYDDSVANGATRAVAYSTLMTTYCRLKGTMKDVAGIMALHSCQIPP